MKENDMPEQNIPEAEDEIDLIELARKLWEEKKLILKWCCVAAVLGIVIAFSIPKEYTTEAILAPELADKKAGGSMAALAGLAGISMGQSGADAVYPDLYPDIVSSVPFVVELFDVPVTNLKGNLQTTVYDYMLNHTRSPWWSVVISAPFKALGWVVSLFKDETAEKEGVDVFRLTPEEARIVKALNGCISVSVDKKTSVITLAVTMQDPLISAVLTDTVMHNLQEYITDYRTNKARHDLEFIQKLFDEAQQNYYAAQQAYADYVDSNQGLSSNSAQTKRQRLQNEMELAFNLYNQMAQQLQQAKAKVQESTPAYTVVQPASVPIKASKPSKLLILVGCVFLAGVIAAAWILFGRGIVAQFRKKPEESVA